MHGVMASSALTAHKKPCAGHSLKYSKERICKVRTGVRLDEALSPDEGANECRGRDPTGILSYGTRRARRVRGRLCTGQPLLCFRGGGNGKGMLTAIVA